MIRRGQFVTIEGIEGIGKTTQLAQVCASLDQADVRYELTREPGGTPIGEKIRELLLDPANTEICQDCELLLMFAARAQHIAQRIRPRLESGTWVICDRFTDSSFAYQGGGRRIGTDRIGILENWVQGELQPDLTLLLDGPPQVAMKRVVARGDKDRFEQEDLAFFERVRHEFLNRANADPGRFRVIDATQTVERVSVLVHESIIAHLASLGGGA